MTPRRAINSAELFARSRDSAELFQPRSEGRIYLRDFQRPSSIWMWRTLCEVRALQLLEAPTTRQEPLEISNYFNARSRIICEIPNYFNHRIICTARCQAVAAVEVRLFSFSSSFALFPRHTHTHTGYRHKLVSCNRHFTPLRSLRMVNHVSSWHLL